MADRLKAGLNDAFMQNEVTGHAHGIASIIHVNIGADCGCDRDLCTMTFDEINDTMNVEMTRAVRRANLVNGVDMMGGRAYNVSNTHDEGVIDRTVETFSRSLKELRAEGAL